MKCKDCGIIVACDKCSEELDKIDIELTKNEIKRKKGTF